MKVLFCIYQMDYADHISIAYLSAVAKQHGYETDFCTLSNFAPKVYAIRPDVVAYSLNVYGFDKMIKAHKMMEEIHDFHSIAGGPEVTFNPGGLEDSGMDVYCMGEGEGAFGDYLDRISAGKNYDDVPNLVTRNGYTPIRRLIEDLDTIPFPDRDLTISNTFLKDEPKKTFYATRGCPYGCYYCANNQYNSMYRGKGKIVRRFSVDRLLEEIKYVRGRYRTEFVKFGDDLFAIKADQWLEDFSRRYKKEVGLQFNCYLRFDTVDKDLLRLLKEAGCFSVHLSVDSTSEMVREQVLGRKMRKVDIVEKLRLIKSYGINTWVNFMLAAPGSTTQDDLASIEVGHAGKVTYIPYTTTVPMKGTRLHDFSISNGLIGKDYIGDLSDCSKRSPYTCFTDKDKDIRYNIFLVGTIISKLPWPLRQLATWGIQKVKPNRLFEWIKKAHYKYMIETKIFKLR